MVTRSKRKARPAGDRVRYAATPGLHLVIGDGGRILRSATVRNAPRDFLQPPFLSPRTAKSLREPFSELVLDVLRRDGGVLMSFGWSWIGEAFLDGPPRRLQRRGRVPISQPLRVLRVPVPRSAAFMLLSQSNVLFGTDDRPKPLERRGLTLYSLVVPAPPRPPLPGFARSLRVLDLPGAASLLRTPPVRPV